MYLQYEGLNSTSFEVWRKTQGETSALAQGSEDRRVTFADFHRNLWQTNCPWLSQRKGTKGTFLGVLRE